MTNTPDPEPEFDLRIMCKEKDADYILAALSHTAVLGPDRRYPARSGMGRVLLYLSAQTRGDEPAP